MAGMAQGAVNSLLGRLTSVLLDEAQLLGGVRGDVEFIKDEMESMNGLLRHLTEAQHRDHQVRAWMKQVAGLARDCEGYVELYVRRVGDPRTATGLVGCLRQLLHLLRTIPARHQIANRIRELKVRARDVGDRRQRYGVSVPAAPPPGVQKKPGGAQWQEEHKEEEDHRRRQLLRGEPPSGVDEGSKRVLDWLLSNSNFRWWRRCLVLIVGRGSAGKTDIAKRVYQHPSVESSFQHRIWVDIGGLDKDPDELRREITRQLMTTTVAPPTAQDDASQDVQQQDCLRRILDQSPPPAGNNKSMMIVLDAVRTGDIQALLADLQSKVLHAVRDRTYAVIITTKHDQGDGHQYGRRVIDTRTWYGKEFDVGEPLRRFFRRKAVALVKSEFPPMLGVLEECYPDALAMQMFLHLLYVDPNRSEGELNGLRGFLRQHKSNIAKAMLMFCYNELPINYKSCLLYLSIFPQDHEIKRTSLLRRWVAEGLIAEGRNSKGRHGVPSTLEDQAERIFDALVARGFVRPRETSTAGKIKSCTVDHVVHEFIASDVGFVDTGLPPDLAHRLSINSGIELQGASSFTGTIDGILTMLENILEWSKGKD